MRFKIVIIIMLLLGAISSYANLIEKINSDGQTLACNMQLDIIKLIKAEDSAHTRMKEKYSSDKITSPNKDTLDGVYIPKDLCEAVQIIDKKISAEVRQKYIEIKDLQSSSYLLPLLTIPPEWSPIYNSRFSNYLESIGMFRWDAISNKIREAFWCYLHNKPFLTTKYLDVNFKLDSNLFVFQSHNRIYDTSNIDVYSCYTIRGIRDSLYLTPAFPNSVKNNGIVYNYVQYQNDTTIRDFSEILGFYQDMKELSSDEEITVPGSDLIPIIDTFDKDSTLVIKTIDQNEYIWYSFAKRIQSALSPFDFYTEKMIFIHSTSVKTLDSIDSVFSQINQRLPLKNSNQAWYDVLNERSSLLNKLLINKKAVEITVVRLFPCNIIDCWVKKEN